MQEYRKARIMAATKQSKPKTASAKTRSSAGSTVDKFVTDAIERIGKLDVRLNVADMDHGRVVRISNSKIRDAS